MPWLYTKAVTLSGPPLEIRRALCPHCRLRLSPLGTAAGSLVTDAGPVYATDATLATCGVCGWWVIAVDDRRYLGGHDEYSHVHAVLETCDVSRIDGTADELQRYLLHHYKQRYEVQPHVWEDIVDQVFRNNGYQTLATARSNDGGIDIFVAERGGTFKAVQVKRYKDKVEASLIREFAGALVLHGLTAGIFVTTSSFTAGAVTTAERFSALQAPLRIDLLDADRFYKDMSFRTNDVYHGTSDETAPFRSQWEETLRCHELVERS